MDSDLELSFDFLGSDLKSYIDFWLQFCIRILIQILVRFFLVFGSESEIDFESDMDPVFGFRSSFRDFNFDYDFESDMDTGFGFRSDFSGFLIGSGKKF